MYISLDNINVFQGTLKISTESMLKFACETYGTYIVMEVFICLHIFKGYFLIVSMSYCSWIRENIILSWNMENNKLLSNVIN